MNPDIKAKWIAALRSGEYKQGRDQLKEDDRYCCLGVLCDLYAKEHGMPFDVRRLGVNRGASGEVYVYPDWAVVAWAGLPGSNPYCGHASSLARENDNGKTFAEIADIIEQQL